MFRSAVFLLFLGLALGLWLGFNPQAHASVIRSWEDAKVRFAHLTPNASSPAVHSATVGTGTNSQDGAKPAAFSWKPVSAFFTSLWESMRGLWAQISTKFKQSS